MTNGTDDPGEGSVRARLLDDLVQARVVVFRLLSEERYDEASEVGDGALAKLARYVSEQSGSDGLLLPHHALGIGLAADLGVAALVAGDDDRAVRLLAELPQLAKHVEFGADRLAAAGLVFCRHGRPSLDGECMQQPPCTP